MDNEASALHSRWVQDLVREAQLFVGAALDVPLARFDEVARRAAIRLPQPSNPAECFAARAVLLDAAIAAGAVLHRRVHGDSPHRCDFSPSEAALRLWHQHRLSPAGFLPAWADAVRSGLGGDRDVFQRAQAWVAQHWCEPLSSAEAGAALRLSAAYVDAIFRRNVGLSFSKYHRGVRLVHAIALLATTDLKVEAVARDVGFRSKKNFYTAFQDWIGVTPRQFRAGDRPPDAPTFGHVPAVFRRQVGAAVRLRARGARAIGMTTAPVTAARGVRARASC